MAKVKSTIVSITQKVPPAFKPAAVFFPINGQPLDVNGVVCQDNEGNSLFTNVSSIVFCKDRYGSGAVYNKPCYIVSFEDVPQVIIIDADDVSQVSVFNGAVEDTENLPARPED